MFRTLTAAFLIAALALPLLLTGCGDGRGKATIAFVTNNPSDFWMIAKAGVTQAEKDFGVVVDFRMPTTNDAALQQGIVEDLRTKGIGGMAISVIDPEGQTKLINEAAAKMNVICHDSDAPKSNRLAFVGSNNFKAGQAAGELLKEALPEGGKVMLFVGSIDAQNAKDRKAGIEDAIKGTKIEILGVRTDGTKRDLAKTNVVDTITKEKDIAGLVGLWSYNGPAIAAAVKEAGKVGQIKIVAFDEEEATLQGVKDGVIHGSVMQDPYMFGYESVRVLAALQKKTDAKIPADKIVETPLTKVKKDNVDQVWKQMKDRIAASKSAK